MGLPAKKEQQSIDHPDNNGAVKTQKMIKTK